MKETEYERPKIEPFHDNWRLVESWHTNCKDVLPERITVEHGFITDGASIPRFLWRICGTPMDIPRIYAAIVHDWLYDSPHLIPVRTDGSTVWRHCERADADRIYRDYQIALGISRIKAYTEYYALRLFAGSHWTAD